MRMQHIVQVNINHSDTLGVNRMQEISHRGIRHDHLVFSVAHILKVAKHYV